MWYVVVALIFLAGFLVSCRDKFKANGTRNIIDADNNNRTGMLAGDKQDGIYSKEDIEEKLLELSKTPPPENLAFGAMCYEPMAPPDTASYTCPVCGEKTLFKFKSGSDWGWAAVENARNGIAMCREEIKKIKGLNIFLDESQFCRHCSPGVEAPKLCLLVNLANSADTAKVCDISYLDIRLIGEFLDGKKVHKTANDGEVPMKEQIGRLEALLGVRMRE